MMVMVDLDAFNLSRFCYNHDAFILISLKVLTDCFLKKIPQPIRRK